MSEIFNLHTLCQPAIEQLQHYLNTEQEWKHNFGLNDYQEGPIIGKMFGVLVVETPQKKIEHLWGFSGKLAEKNLFDQFVPPVFDTLAENSFLSAGMEKLSEMSIKIKYLKEQQPVGFEKQMKSLQNERRNFSVALQNQLFESYHFLNQADFYNQLL